MKRLIILKICIIIFSVVVSVPCGFAREGTTEGQSTKYKVMKGFAEADSVKYPVFIGIREVDAIRFGGITYTMTQKKQKHALLMAEKLKRFYVGKKIGTVVLPAFKKVGKPETVAWYSLRCGSGNEGAQAVVKVDDKTVIVYLLPTCDEGVLAMML